MSHVVAVGSPKGGVGKSTYVWAVAWVLARRGYRVGVLDCDMNQAIAKWANNGKHDNVTVKPEITEHTIGKALGELETDCDVIFIDLPGSKLSVNLMAYGLSDAVVLPTRTGSVDIGMAKETYDFLTDPDNRRTFRTDRVRLLITQLNPAYLTLVDRHGLSQAFLNDLPLMDTALFLRKAFNEMQYTGVAPSGDVPQEQKAAENAADLTDDLLGLLAASSGPAYYREQLQRPGLNAMAQRFYADYSSSEVEESLEEMEQPEPETQF